MNRLEWRKHAPSTPVHKDLCIEDDISCSGCPETTEWMWNSWNIPNAFNAGGTFLMLSLFILIWWYTSDMHRRWGKERHIVRSMITACVGYYCKSLCKQAHWGKRAGREGRRETERKGEGERERDRLTWTCSLSGAGAPFPDPVWWKSPQEP